MNKQFVLLLVSAILVIPSFGQSWLPVSGLLKTDPITTKILVGSATMPDNVKMAVYGDNLAAGSNLASTALSSYITSYGSYFKGRTLSYLGSIGNWQSGGDGAGVRGTLYSQSSTTNSRTVFSGGGIFANVLESYIGTSTNPYYNYVCGSMGYLTGTVSSVGSNVILAGLIGKDAINSDKTYAGYFEGRGYFSGNVGIGTTSLNAQLSVGGNAEFRKSSGETNLTIASNAGSHSRLKIEVADANKFGIISWLVGSQQKWQAGYCGDYGNGGWYLYNVSNQSYAMLVNSTNDFIGIGNTDPQYKLDVTGTIRAQEIKVELASIDALNVKGEILADNIKVKANGNTADFVFADDYELKDLNEVESFVKENKHLPDVPSAKAMEENGVNLAEMNKVLLQKVEELTLYLIQQQKEIEALKASINK